MANYRRVFADGYSYYITIVTHKRIPILIDNIELLRESFSKSKKVFNYRINAIVVMPDHLHMVITPEKSEEYPKIIGYIKSYFSRHCDNAYFKEVTQSSSRYKKRYKPIWQKRYYEHTIRSEKDMIEKIIYMRNNPVKHGWTDTIEKWKYSSFYKS